MNKKMYVILICPYLNKVNFISLLYFQTNVFEFVVNFLTDGKLTIFGWKYQMIYQYCYVMTLVYIDAHPSILSVPPQAARNSFFEGSLKEIKR